MINNTYPVLCGGTFFTLVLAAKREGPGKRSQLAGKLSEFTQPEVLAGLGRVVYAEYVPAGNKKVRSTNATSYRSCENDGTNLSFLYPQAVSAFDIRVKSEYLTALKFMCEFTSRFLEVGTSVAQEVWIVKCLLDLINSDQSIEEGQVFYIGETGQGITKADLRKKSDFCLQSFLLGVWHFVVVSRYDNKCGKATFDQWCPSSGNRTTREYEGSMGEGITRAIKVRLLDPTLLNATEVFVEPLIEEPEPDTRQKTYEINEDKNLVDLFEDAIDQYSIATYVDSDFTAESLMFSAVVAVDEFIAVMRGTLRKFRRQQDETYRNVIAFVNTLEQYHAFLSVRMICDDGVCIHWLPRTNWTEVHSFTRGCRRELDKLYGLISGGCSLSINGATESDPEEPRTTSTQTVNNQTAMQQTGNIQIGNNNLIIGSIESLTINND